MNQLSNFRQVWREINDGNRDIKLLVVQQWWEDRLYALTDYNKEDESKWRESAYRIRIAPVRCSSSRGYQFFMG